jgi:hypothetical protein
MRVNVDLLWMLPLLFGGGTLVVSFPPVVCVGLGLPNVALDLDRVKLGLAVREEVRELVVHESLSPSVELLVMLDVKLAPRIEYVVGCGERVTSKGDEGVMAIREVDIVASSGALTKHMVLTQSAKLSSVKRSRRMTTLTYRVIRNRHPGSQNRMKTKC